MSEEDDVKVQISELKAAQLQVLVARAQAAAAQAETAQVKATASQAQVLFELAKAAGANPDDIAGKSFQIGSNFVEFAALPEPKA